MSLPSDDGLAIAAEWALHARCWMAWPTRIESWGEHLDAARDCVAELANTVAEFEPVSMITKPKNVAEVSLVTGAGVSQISMTHDDCWIRDMGPCFVVGGGGEVAGVTWNWNGWGHRFDEIDRDASVATTLLDRLAMRRYRGDLVVEGGAVHCDGEGTLITSECVLLNPNRNPGLSKEQVEEKLIQSLGVRHVIWLGEGLQDDVRGGHVENLARFVRPGVILATACSDPADPNHRICEDNLHRLRQTRDAAGRQLEIIEVEQPRPRFDANGRRLAMSYVSFYMPNSAIVLPAFEDGQADKRAFDVVTRLFPKREIVQHPAIELAYGGGGIHSICLPLPVGNPAKPF